MKAKQILEDSAKKNMIQWNQGAFSRTHPRLYKTIIEAINQALIIDSVVGQSEKLCGTCTDFNLQNKMFVCKKCGKQHKTISA